MIDIRFHLLSLIAVFLSLGVGMLIGSTLPGQESFLSKQDAAISELRKEFALLRGRERSLGERIAGLEQEVSLGETFAASVAPLLIEGRLAGRRVFIVSNRRSAVHERLEEVLQRAGAQVRFVRFDPGVPQDGPAALRAIAGAGDAAVLVFSPGQAARGAEEGIRSLAGGLRRAGVVVAGAETRDARPSVIPMFKRAGIPSVDDADLTVGAITLVFLLDGFEGHFGIKETAEEAFPRLAGGGGP